MQNDPVNFTDPSGLLPWWDFGWGGAGANVGWSGFGGWGGGFDLNRRPRASQSGSPQCRPGEVCYDIYIGDGSTAVSFGAYRPWFGYRPQDTPRQERSDCQKFTDMVQEMANSAKSITEFMDKLASTFTAANNSTQREMLRTQNDPLPAGRPSFGAGGFLPQFRDNSNQVRHFVGSFIASSSDPFFGLITMNNRETPGRDDADIRLNFQANYLAREFVNPGRPIDYSSPSSHPTIENIRANFAPLLRQRLCGHS